MSNIFGKIGSAFKGLNPNSSTEDKANAQKMIDTLESLQSQPSYRQAEGTPHRDNHLMTWRLPNGSTVKMYINPQSLEIRESKQISSTRTKGGFIVQYWGANLTEIVIRGVTGSAGVQGINVLRDIYLAENRAFDLVAATQVSELSQAFSSDINVNDASSALSGVAETLRNRNFILRPSLASLATSVLMFYQGVEYKGFFTNFSMVESAERVGIFEYNMTFMSTETRGRRENVFAWQKEPLATDMAGQLINGVGNAIRRSLGFEDQAPEQFGPFDAPYTFGGSSLPASLGASSTQQRDLLTKGKLF